jgi:excinuclease ABC subunit C
MLEQKISKIPVKSGVYIFKDPKNKILYVGKAKNLRNRLSSYFRKKAALDPRKSAMMKLVSDFTYVLTESELEALVLEANLIKQYKPPFNVVLRDDKNYPYLKLTVQEEWPRLEVVRKIVKDGSIYFGPYVPAQSMWDALAFIRRNFPLRTCAHILDKPTRPCIQYQIDRCPAPCDRKIHRNDYMKIVEEVRLFLSGQKTELLKGLEEKMDKLSQCLKFEEAARIRDRIKNIKRAWESQRVVSPELGDMDIIGFYSDGMDAAFDIFFVRGGVLIGTKDFFIGGVWNLSAEEIISSFIELFYAKQIIPPKEIIVTNKPDYLGNLKTWLKERKGDAVQIKVPREGKKAELLKMAIDNAEQLFSDKKTSIYRILKTIKDRFDLPFIPREIGAFDVSTIAGSESVGAFIYWSDGDFRKQLYRRLKIKGVAGIDDYSMMNEIITRTLKNLGSVTPSLIVIDGGKGQLDVARKVVKREDVTCENGKRPMLLAIAKDPDRVITLSSKVADLGDGSPSSLLLRKIRDEVHRFAVSYHRRLRDRRLMESPLEKISGIGKKRRLELLRFFGSIEAIRNASIEDITGLKGFNKKIAEDVINGLRKQ